MSGRALLVGTKKGLFIGHADGVGREWRFTGPHCSGTWAFYEVAYDSATPTIYAGGASNWYGPAVWRSDDDGATWEHSSVGLTLGDRQPPVEQIWRIVAVGSTLYAGADPAALFRSDDGGRTWQYLPALREHANRDGWRPSNAGLPLCAIVPGHRAGQLWVGLSCGGVYRTDDGGETWTRGDQALHPCVHALESVPNGDSGTPALVRLAHDGIHRSVDGGQTWQDASGNLPSRFGFALAVAAAHKGAGSSTETVYTVPLDGAAAGRRHMANGHFAVWRTRDGGDTWQELRSGLPQEHSYASVLRRGLVVDPNDPLTVYCGTATGQLYSSFDGGDTWHEVARALPPIYALACAARM